MGHRYSGVQAALYTKYDMDICIYIHTEDEVVYIYMYILISIYIWLYITIYVFNRHREYTPPRQGTVNDQQGIDIT